MADAVQTVRRGERTVPDHLERIRVRESRPVVVHLAASGLNQFVRNNFIIA